MVFRINLTPEPEIWLILMLTRSAQSCKSFILLEVRHKTIPTKRRKQLRSNLAASWKLKEDKYRIFYDIIGDTVDILAIGYNIMICSSAAGK